MPVQPHLITSFFDSFIQPVTHGLHMRHIFFQIAAGNFAGHAQADDFEHIFGPGAHGHFLSSAMHHFCRCQPLANVQGTDTFRGVNLMPGNRQQVHSKFLDID